MERDDSWLVLQDDLEPEARELGIAYTQYRVPACRLTYFHRNEHLSLNRATLQLPWSEGRVVGVSASRLGNESLLQLLRVLTF